MTTSNGAPARKLGKYFTIRSAVNSQALSVLGGYPTPGARVVPNASPVHESGVWYEDSVTGTIRYGDGEHVVLDCSDYRRLMINTYQLGNDNQQWCVAGDSLQHRLRPSKALAVRDGTADVVVVDTSSPANHRWTFEHLSTDTYFYIESELHGLVLEAGPGPGSNLTVQVKTGSSPRQQWWEDATGALRARGTDLVFTYNEDYDIVMTTHDSVITPGFSYSGGMIHNLQTNQQHFVVDIPESKENPGTVMYMHQMHGGPNQKWKMVEA